MFKMQLPELTYKESSILNNLVKNFVKSATPIGSKFLSAQLHGRMSPATIRNVLMTLEKKGLAHQPHTSAGRMPTDLGYRYYVNDLMKIERLSQTEKRSIDANLKHIADENVDTILDKACEVLSEISNQLGVVLEPRFYKGVFQKLQLFRLSESKLLVVISLSDGFVRTILMEIKFSIPDNKIRETERILNERLSGLALKTIRKTIKKRVRNVNYGDPALIHQVADLADSLFTVDSNQVHFKGALKILSQPEFSEKEHLAKILQLIDNRDILVHIVKNSSRKGDRISITIGQEHRDELVKNCSLISAPYKIGDITGTIAVIGPTRIQYEKMAALVDYIAKGINQLFS
ncbi:MAG: heat-inducible transcription repressor HrcA [Calditrichaeota bacterium]|nr:heat-inducible transcription repressor HrcA [Calditrichota bacterium]